MRHPSLKLLGHGWEQVDGRCHPIRHTLPTLLVHLLATGPAEESEEDENEDDDKEEGDDVIQRRRGIHWNMMI